MKSEAQEKLKFIDSIIGKEVKRYRKRSKLNQSDLAPLIGLEQSALSRVESGKQMLTAAQWVLLCARLFVPNQLTSLVRREMQP